MAQLLVRKLESRVKALLKKRAREQGRSVEEEVRLILREAVGRIHASRPGLGSRLAARFKRVALDSEIAEVRKQPARPADVEC